MAADLRTIEEHLRKLTRAGELYRPVGREPSDRTVLCLGCAHKCRIADGGRGICAMRYNHGGRLRVPFGYVSGVACDPVEKKPFYHFLPGQAALSYGMLGCNFHCEFCQNWVTSQTLKDPAAAAPVSKITPEELLKLAAECDARIIASTYNEPLITSEWSKEIFTLARSRGLRTAYVSNGFASLEVMQYLAPVLDAMNVDLKCFTDSGYQRLGGRLQPVLDTIRFLQDNRIWQEIVTLIVPGFNDSKSELTAIAEFIANVSPAIPWHVTAYHPSYKMTSGTPSTPIQTILDAVEIGHQAGLPYVYGGNVAGLDRNESSFCHDCGRLLIIRHGFATRGNDIQQGCCPDCQTPIPGIWE